MKSKKRTELLSIVSTKAGEEIQREIAAIRGDSKKVKRDIDPYKDTELTEKLLAKTNTKLFMNINKSNQLVLGRSFNNEIIDMLQFKIVDCKLTKDFDVPGFELHSKYFILLNNIKDKRKENLFIDLLNMRSSKICLEGVNYCWVVSRTDSVFVWKYCRVFNDNSIQDVGPSLNMVLENAYHCGDEKYKLAVGENSNKKKSKNTYKNAFNDKIGVLHIDKQDLKEVKTRKSKAYKLNRAK
ncbi:Ribosome production factor 2 like protein [Nosema granulosis]|uniref:Ribosome production factor 2 homolog n=1 Tax=Nosema granulosis TaxID=83296 RepID=A0A9P6KYH6_9MICR|nr:Ribosome production factor 2 like protein [Nosema granulosis]